VSREKDQEIVRLYVEEKLTQSEIGERVGYTQSGVGVVLRRNGVVCKDPRHIDWPKDDMKRWYEEDGMTVEAIAHRLGRHRVVTNKVLRRIGCSMRSRGPKRGPGHPEWKGGRRRDVDGYILVYCPDHPYATASKTVREHRLVMEQMLGRYLEPHEVVHHKNDVKDDNRPENLELFSSNAEHLAATLVGKVPKWTEEGLARIAEGVRKRRPRKASHPESARDEQA